tara:strand:+ start:247 stop:1548 length:1302 start_codon:yes stop_codon:yes gene_type:complete
MSYDMNTLLETYRLRLDIQNVRRIFSIGRPAGAIEETEWVNTYLYTPEMQKMGMYKDGFAYMGEVGEGNCIIEVGEGSRTLFSSHTDTVHRTGGPQNVMIDLEESKLITDSGQCLGADDGTGIWLMLELIKAGVPGLYIFHRAEEVGGQGSAFIANHHADLLQNYDRAIAFDRKDDWSIITHQGGSRCCSDVFGKDLAEKLDMGHRLDTGGSFTDTANYDGIIPECTNLSVGCHNCHSGRENQEIPYLLEFRDALINVDWENLVTVRDPTIPDYSYGGSSGFGGSYYYQGSSTKKPETIVIEEKDYKEWDNQINDKPNKWEEDDEWEDDHIPHDVWDGSYDYLWDKDINDMSEREWRIWEKLSGGEFPEDLDKFFDDEDELPTTAQGFQDWSEPTKPKPADDNEVVEDEEEEIIPDAKGQEYDWDSWFGSESL